MEEATSAPRATPRTQSSLTNTAPVAGVAIQQNDIWIAALCKQHGFALATRDQGFQHVLGLEIVEVSPPAQP